MLSACRGSLTHLSRIFRGSAAVLPVRFGLLSLLVGVSSFPRMHCAGLFLMCGPSPRFHRATLTVADFRRFISSPYDDLSFSPKRWISQGKTRDFRSIYPPHLRSSGLDDVGLPVCLLLRPPDVRLIRF